MHLEMSSGPWKVGDLAKITGITIRTLHHYDEIGLLSPSQHTESGHRLYGHSEVERLQQIVTLRHLGLSLEQVREALDGENFSSLETVKSLRREKHQQRIELEDLEERLERIEQLIAKGEKVSIGKLIEIIKLMTLYEKYFTKEQLVKVTEIENGIAPERVEQMVKFEWPRLIKETQAEMEKGTPPSDPKVRALARQWMKLVEEKTAGDAELGKFYKTIIDNEPWFGASFVTMVGHPGADLSKLINYIGQASGT